MRLFGGPNSLANKLWEQIKNVNYNWQVACAPTAQAAWWLSKAQPCLDVSILSKYLAQPALAMEQLNHLPTTVLDLRTDKHQALLQCGLHCIGDMLNLPRDGLARRAGTEILYMLDRAFGRAVEAREIAQEPLTFQIKRSMPFHSTEQRLVEALMCNMLGELEQWLIPMKRGTNKLEWFFDLPNTKQTLTLHSARLLQRRTEWAELLHHRLHRMQFADEVRDISLICVQHTSIADQTLSLLPQTHEAEASWMTLCDELRQRVGEQSIQFIKPVADPRPEYSVCFDTNPPMPRKKQLLGKPSINKAARHDAPRYKANLQNETLLASSAQWPLMLLNTPEKIRGQTPNWHNQRGWRLVSGPERVEFGWWSEAPVHRDYYRAINSEHVQAWVFQDLSGCDAQRTQWYIHGYFA